MNYLSVTLEDEVRKTQRCPVSLQRCQESDMIRLYEDDFMADPEVVERDTESGEDEEIGRI